MIAVGGKIPEGQILPRPFPAVLTVVALLTNQPPLPDVQLRMTQRGTDRIRAIGIVAVLLTHGLGDIITTTALFLSGETTEGNPLMRTLYHIEPSIVPIAIAVGVLLVVPLLWILPEFTSPYICYGFYGIICLLGFFIVISNLLVLTGSLQPGLFFY